MVDLGAIERHIKTAMQEHHVPGFAVAIIIDRTVAYARGFGVTSSEAPTQPVTPDTLFCSGSIGKSFVGVAALRLAEQGTLALDEPITTYLPWLTFSKPQFASGVTMRRLLSHSSGLFGTGDDFGPRDLSGLERFVRHAIPATEFVAPPGTAFNYCNLGFMLAGHVIETVTGTYFPEAIQHLVFDPLGMQQATYDRTVAMTYPVALPHHYDEHGQPTVQHRMFDNAAGNPAGQVMASTQDLVRFSLMCLHQGKAGTDQILAPSSLKEMLTPHAWLHDRNETRYGLTFWILNYKGREWVGHAGLLTPYMCEIALFPDDGLGIIFQCNATNAFSPWEVRRLITDQVLALPSTYVIPHLPRPKDEPPSWHIYEGTFLSLGGGLATIRLMDNQVWLERDEQQIPLLAWKTDHFINEEKEVAVGFLREGEGNVNYFMLDELPYERVDVTVFRQPDTVLMQSYTGTYVFPDRDTAHVRLMMERLFVTFSWIGQERLCTPLDLARFACRDGVIRFEVTPTGLQSLVISGFLVATASTNNR